MVTKLGMSNLGNISLRENEYNYKDFSDSTNRRIDQECQLILNSCNEKATELVRKHKESIDRLSELLLEKKTIDINDITLILGRRDNQ